MAYFSHELFIVRRNVELFHMPPKFMFNVNKKAAIVILNVEFWAVVTCSSTNPPAKIHIAGHRAEWERERAMHDLVKERWIYMDIVLNIISTNVYNRHIKVTIIKTLVVCGFTWVE